MANPEAARTQLSKDGLTVREGMIDWGSERVIHAKGYTWEGVETDSVYVQYTNDAMTAITLFIPYDGTKTMDRVTDILTTKFGEPARFGEDFAGWDGNDGDLVSVGVEKETDLLTVRFAPDNFVFNDSTTVRDWPLGMSCTTVREEIEDMAKEAGCTKKRIEDVMLVFKNYKRNGYTADSLVVHIDSRNRVAKEELYFTFPSKAARETAAKAFVDETIQRYGPHAVTDADFVFWNVGEKEAINIGMHGSAATLLVTYDPVVMERLQHVKR
jgi:hypothetical protein